MRFSFSGAPLPVTAHPTSSIPLPHSSITPPGDLRLTPHPTPPAVAEHNDSHRRDINRAVGEQKDGQRAKEKGRGEEPQRATAQKEEQGGGENREGSRGSSAKWSAEEMKDLLRQFTDFTEGVEMEMDIDSAEEEGVAEGEEGPRPLGSIASTPSRASAHPLSAPHIPPPSSTALVLHQRRHAIPSQSSSGAPRQVPLGVFAPPTPSSPLFTEFVQKSTEIDPPRPTYPKVHLPATPPTAHVKEGLALDSLWQRCGYGHLRDLNPANLELPYTVGKEGLTEEQREEMAGIRRIEEEKRRIGEGKGGTKTRQERQQWMERLFQRERAALNDRHSTSQQPTVHWRLHIPTIT